MFNNLTDRIIKTFDNLTGKGVLSEQDVSNALREIRVALLEADVPLSIAKNFIEDIRKKATGEKLLKSIKPGDLVVKIVHDSLCDLLGANLSDELYEIGFKSSPTSIIMVGLQGSGKTTTCAKLANYLKKSKKNVLLASLDLSRPAAVEQLQQLAKSISIDAVHIDMKKSKKEIIDDSFKQAKELSKDVIIFDTAGRTTIDAELMSELKEISGQVMPSETLLVVDAMTGQDSVNIAKSFSEYINISGIVLSRVDGDSKGGAALSMTVETGKPIKFLGIGEKVTALEKFSARRVAGRILDMGDVVGIVEKAEQDFDDKEAEKLVKKINEGKFDLEDFKKQLDQIKKLGGIKGILSLMPGIRKAKKALDQTKLEDKSFLRMTAIISSMTKIEKKEPKLINGSRKRRIARGSGVDIQDVNRLLKQFKNMQLMMKKIRKKGFGSLEKMIPNNLSSNNLGNIYNDIKR